MSQFALGRLAQDAGARSIAERHFADAARRLPHRSARRATSTRASAPWPRRSRPAAASTSDRPPTPTTRWSSGWSTRRCCPICWPTSWRWPCARRCSPTSRWWRSRHPAATCASWPSPAATPARRGAWSRLGLEGGAYGAVPVVVRPLGADGDGPRQLMVASTRPWSDMALRRLRMMAAVAHQGFELCAARERPGGAPAAVVGASARTAAAPASSAPRPRCNASSIRCSGCRATTSPCSSPARAAPARS